MDSKYIWTSIVMSISRYISQLSETVRLHKKCRNRPKVHLRVVPVFRDHFLVLMSSATVITLPFISSRIVSSATSSSQNDACLPAQHVCNLSSGVDPRNFIKAVFPGIVGVDAKCYC